MSRYVGIDLHRRRSVVVILDGDGEKLSSNATTCSRTAER